MPEPQLVRLEVRFGFGRDLILASKNALDSRLREGAAIEAYRTKSVSHLGASAQVDAPFSFV